MVLTLPDGRYVTVTLLSSHAGRASLGFDAPADVVVDREEVALAKRAASARKGVAGG